MKIITFLALACACAFAQRCFAQTFTWRASTYGVESSVAGLAPQSLAFDANDDLYTLEYVAAATGTAVRLTHYATAVGAISWQTDVDASTYAMDYRETNDTVSTAAMAPIGIDAVVATTNYDSQFFAQVSRYRGGDGGLQWQTAEHADNGVGYNAAAVDNAGDIVATGSVGAADSSLKGHAAKYHGADGSLAWSVDIDPTQCGGGFFFYLTTVAIDSNGDVITAGESLQSGGTSAFCAFKLSGSDGSIVWSRGYQPPSLVQFSGSVSVVLDGSGNPLVASNYYSSGNASPAALVKLDASSGAVLWAQDPLVGQLMLPGAFALDADGNAIVSSQVTRKYSASDGHLMWAQDAPVAGAVAVDSNSSIIVAQNDALDPSVTTGRKIDFFGLSPVDGSQLWSSSYSLNTVAYWDYFNPVATDHSGHFAALQTQSEICCEEIQAVALHGSTGDGSIDWHFTDRDFAPSNAYLLSPDPAFNRTSALTPDDGIVTVGMAHRGTSNDIYSDGSGRIMTVKRSTIDGRLLWREIADLGLDYCVPSTLVVDANGDVVVGGNCDDFPRTIKYRGSDGAQLWVGSESGTCDSAVVQSVAVDEADDVYATGWCVGGADSGQITVKYSGADGTVLWTTETDGTLSSYGPFLVGISAESIVVAATQEIVNGKPETRIVVNRLRSDNGNVVWTRNIDPASGGSFDLSVMAVYPNGDAVVAGSALTAKLDSGTGNTKWMNLNNPGSPIATLLDNATSGDILFAGSGQTQLWKLNGATGASRWTSQDARLQGFYAGLNDVTIAPDGNVLATGAGYAVQNGNLNLYVVSVDDTTGAQRWSLIDTASDYDVGIGVLVANDGGVLVSTDYVVPDSSPWSLVRISGPFADGIFANGFEP